MHYTILNYFYRETHLKLEAHLFWLTLIVSK